MIRKIDAQLRYYMRVDPDRLSDDDWSKVYNELVWIREQEKEASENG